MAGPDSSTDGDHGTAARQAEIATLTASRAMLGVIARSLTDVLELVTLPQFRVMVVLMRSGPLRVGALAAAVGAVPSTFSRFIDRMVSAGWVTRSENPLSRRETLIHLSPHGHQLVVLVTERRRRELSAVLATMSREHQRALTDAFELFAEAAGEPPAEDLLILAL
jgi:DNA-binding MarR family transcriptional regulator